MKASEAKQLTNRARVPDMDRVYAAIETSARIGGANATFDVEKINSHQINSTIEELRRNGYTVERSTHSDFRESWDTLNISW